METKLLIWKGPKMTKKRGVAKKPKKGSQRHLSELWKISKNWKKSLKNDKNLKISQRAIKN